MTLHREAFGRQAYQIAGAGVDIKDFLARIALKMVVVVVSG
jgi:hypothetical protein